MTTAPDPRRTPTAEAVSAAEREMARLAGDATPLLAVTDAWGRLLSAGPSLARLLGQSPEIAVASAELNRARWAVQRACAGRYPNIQTGASVHQDTDTGYTVAGVQVGVAVPLFDWNQGNIARAQADAIAARRNVDRVRLALQARLASTPVSSAPVTPPTPWAAATSSESSRRVRARQSRAK